MKTILLSCLLLCVLFVSLSQACSCFVGPDPLYSNFASGATRVFHGRAVARQQRESDGAELWTFNVARMYKGSPKADNRVKVLIRPTSCMPYFAVGKVYLVGMYNGEAISCNVALWSSVPKAARSFLREVALGNGNFTHDVDCAAPCPKVNWVCGSNDKSYKSLCDLQHAALCPAATTQDDPLKYVSTGCCKADFTRQCATLVYHPYCGSDGVTYSDPCSVQRAQCASNSVLSFTDGECPDDCDRMCAAIYAPVCGSDGNTYSSECHLQIASCQSEKPITVASQGECPARECERMCADVYAPVCGSDGNTYSSECHLQIASCQSEKPITVASQGECDAPTCSPMCPAIYAPVCGSDGNTYSSECHLQYAACSSGKTITIASQGECPARECDRMCAAIYAPVCGSDGNTYSSECHLQIASCQSEAVITVASQGECSK